MTYRPDILRSSDTEKKQEKEWNNSTSVILYTSGKSVSHLRVERGDSQM
jgi:hypothetical protein